MKETVIYQGQKKSCGYACVKMALVHASSNKTYRQIREPDCNGKSPSIQEIQEFGKEYGLCLNAWKVDPRDILLAEEFPLLCVISKNGLAHMVYLKKKRRNRFLVFDPSAGEMWIKEEEFANSFSGVYLDIGSFHETKKPKPQRILGGFGPALQMASALLGVICFALASLSLDGKRAIWSPVFLLAGMVSVFVFALAAMLETKRFDSKYQKRLISTDIGNRRRLFHVYYRYRADAISGPTLRVLSFAIPLAFSGVLSLQDPLLGITLVMELGLLLVSWISDVPVAENAKKKLETIEQSFQYAALSEEGVEKKLEEMNRSSRNLSRYYFLRQAMMFAVAVGFSLLSLFIQEELTFGRVAFYSISSVFFLLQIDRCFQSIRDGQDRKKSETAFRQHFLGTVANTRTHGGGNGLE